MPRGVEGEEGVCWGGGRRDEGVCALAWWAGGVAAVFGGGDGGSGGGGGGRGGCLGDALQRNYYCLFGRVGAVAGVVAWSRYRSFWVERWVAGRGSAGCYA